VGDLRPDEWPPPLTSPGYIKPTYWTGEKQNQESKSSVKMEKYVEKGFFNKNPKCSTGKLFDDQKTQLKMAQKRPSIGPPTEKRGNFCPRTTEFMVSMALIPVLIMTGLKLNSQ